MVGAGIYMIMCFLKEIWSILQLPINFSYHFDARFVKHAFIIYLSMLIMAMCIKSNSGFWIFKNSFFCDFTQKYKLSALKFNFLSGLEVHECNIFLACLVIWFSCTYASSGIDLNKSIIYTGMSFNWGFDFIFICISVCLNE